MILSCQDELGAAPSADDAASQEIVLSPLPTPHPDSSGHRPDHPHPIRIGLIGCGAVATEGHLPAITATPGLELAAICDPDRQRLDTAQKQFKATAAFTDPAAFFEADLDAIAITSPVRFHVEHVLAAAAHGRHALCEKPLAVNDREAQAMIDAMDQANRMLVVGFTYRFSPVATTIKRLIEQRAIGEPRSLRLIYVWDCHGRYNRRADPSSGLQLRREGRMTEGGPMVDCGVHQIDLARWWLKQEVIGWTAAGAWVEDHEAPDHVYLHLQHERGTHSTVEISFSYGHTARERVSSFIYEIVGTDGVIRFDRERRLFELRNSEGTTQLPYDHVKAFPQMYAAFHKALVDGSIADLPTGRDGRIATSLATAATEQVKRTRPAPTIA